MNDNKRSTIGEQSELKKTDNKDHTHFMVQKSMCLNTETDLYSDSLMYSLRGTYKH